MGFIASIFTAIVEVVVGIVEAVVQVVEMVVQLIMVLFGYDGGSTQIVEYFEVRNYPLFEDVDNRTPVKNSVLKSVISGADVSANLAYHLTFRSLKANIAEFTKFIEQGNYFENFPDLDSYILTIDYSELTDALQTLTGVACTVENAYLRALTRADWVKYWLQENKGYDVGINQLGGGYETTSTSPAIPAVDTVQVTPSANHFDVDITSDVVTSDETVIDQRWQVNLNTIQYNATPDTYTVEVYNAAGVTQTLPYTVPSKPTQLHYVSTYYQNSTPSRIYLFIYQAGSGTYTDLDTIENPIQIDNANLQAMPAIPLRLNNSNFSTFGATKAQQITDLVAILNLDAQDVIDTIMGDSGIAPGDLDHVYINFGVRMWDTSQAGLSYLFRMFENLFPAQGTTQGVYNNTPTGDDKPQNNILIKCDDYEYAFQWSYITYQFTPLATINANSGSTENGIYYSDMSKFDGNNVLAYNYYVSSGKGTYNVGYKADTLTEVANFLAGNGTPNPGTTSGEAANWLQVTERMSYNNPSPVLQESDGTTSTLIYLTPDAVYENNGSGVLRYVQQAAPETTVGQSITYYCCKPSGLDAYTVQAPIGALKVIDGESGKFKIVKFNLGAKDDLMAPFIYSFVKDLSHNEVAKLFLAGAHASLYVAHYEVIEHAGMSFLTALVMIIIIIVIVVITIKIGGSGKEGDGLIAGFMAAAEVGILYAVQTVLIPYIAKIAFKMIVQAFIQAIITELVDDPQLAAFLSFLSAVAVSMADFGPEFGPDPTQAPTGSYGHTGGATIGAGGGSLSGVNPQATSSYRGFSMSFKSPSSYTMLDVANLTVNSLNLVGTIRELKLADELDELDKDLDTWQREKSQKLLEIQDLRDELAVEKNYEIVNALNTRRTTIGMPSVMTASMYYAANTSYYHELRINGTTSYNKHDLAEYGQFDFA